MTIRNSRSYYPNKTGFSVDMFTDEELEEIHLATLEMLWDNGMHVTNEEALDIFADAGAKVNRSEGKVRIPPYMVEDAIKSAPPQILMAGRDPENDVVIGGSRVNFTTFGAGVKIEDLETGGLRDTLKQDVADTALVADYLDQIDIYSHAVTGGDSPDANIDLHDAEAFLNNTTKHCHHIDLTCGENAKKYFEMGAAIMGGMDELRERPIISGLVCPQSPLELHGDAAQIIIEHARAGIPVNVLSMAMSGATCPVSVAGTLVDHNAEVLTGVILTQLVNKGAPVIYGSSTTTFDLQHSTAPVGAPELGMCNAGVAKLARYYNLPSYTAGG
ncbi:trimethylamine methyltransferase [Acetohalobium arabaticum DSM 5501]|uniref:Trimethylamine methyltransferase n=1 Tax=Acetohalobium arabaticum (strain ATCC 49924 / DSM 5501 / Z-7288) TaxID=574087 RepID=D9QUA6_ACEAZ|nr:trimethylamine methyltransferase [Acetohalobium arabaticum DSM 5501]